MRNFLGAAILLILPGANASSMTIKDYREIMATKDTRAIDVVRTYVRGVGDGMEYASIEADRMKQKSFYCAPNALAMQTDNYIDILDQTIKRLAQIMSEDELNKSLVTVMLGIGLEKTFPCKGH